MSDTADHPPLPENAPPTSPSGKTAPARTPEHRLALIMNGGVSLAVWMGGLTHEIDLVRRASAGLPRSPGAGAAENALFDTWTRICRSHHVRVVVDVIASSSAGGLNGAFLATAIARGADMAGLRELWMTQGQLSTQALLAPQKGGALSLLNGQVFLDGIEGAIAAMTPLPGSTPGEQISLTLTATALDGPSRLVMDSNGRKFRVADHRRRFVFNRHGPHQEYTPGVGFAAQPSTDHFSDTATLALAGRASASFPVAFAPVGETAELRARRHWPDWETGPALDWLADGGILDSAPFQPVLERIALQGVNAAWDRTVCYVVPSAEEGTRGRDVGHAPGTSAGAPTLPPPWTSVGAAGIGLPGEVDLRDDIEEMHEAIRAGRTSFDVDRFQVLVAPPAAGPDLLAIATKIAGDAMRLYQQSCWTGAVYQVRDILVDAQPDGYLTPSVEVKASPITQVPPTHPWLPAAFPADLPAEWDWGLAAADRVVRILLRAVREENAAAADDLRADISLALRKIEAMTRSVDDLLDQRGRELVDAKVPLTNDDIAAELDRAYDQLAIQSAAGEVIRDIFTEFATRQLGDAGRAGAALRAALSVEVSNHAGSVPSGKTRPLFKFARVGITEPPAIFVGAVTDAIEDSGKARPDDILYGTRLGHFAAFGEQRWREWDWMWGRLHAVQELGLILNFSQEDIAELTLAVLAAENRDVEGVKKEIAEVLNMDQLKGENSMIQALRADDRISPALDDLLDFLAHPGPTSPLVPTPLTTAGGWLSAVVARSPGSIGLLQRTVRFALSPVRKRVWRAIGPK